MKCSLCNSKKELKRKKISYRYKECGLDTITLKGVEEARCEDCGEAYYNFGDIEELHGEIAKTLCLKKEILTGKEIKFIRKYLGFSGAVFVKLVGYEVEHLSRLENGSAAVQEVFDRLVRALVFERLPDREYNLHDLILNEKAIETKDWLEFSFSKKDRKWFYNDHGIENRSRR